jgi:uncharacterized Rossmann fold enzyme
MLSQASPVYRETREDLTVCLSSDHELADALRRAVAQTPWVIHFSRGDITRNDRFCILGTKTPLCLHHDQYF